MSPNGFRITFSALALSLLVLGPRASEAVTATGRLQIIHMNVGQGDGTVIISPLGECVLIDDGLYNNTAAPVAQLAALGVTHVRHHFASHYHADHIGAISQIVNSGVTIDYGWDRAQSYSSGTYTTYVNTLTPGNKRRTLVKNQVIMLDSLSAHPVLIKCVDLSGAGIATSDENAKSVMLKVSYGEFDESFGGDLVGSNSSSNDIETTVGPEVGPVEVYKVHHHGSRYSSNDNWLNATTPKIGVIQCGNGNSYGHPTAEALTRLHNHGVRTYWNQTGAGAAPNPAWDKVANGQVIISATWEPGGIDTVRGPGFADTFTNSGVLVDLTDPTVQVTAPNGGETVKAGASRTLTWTASDNVGVTSVNLEYSLKSGVTWSPIATGIANSGSYAWPVPNTPSAQARVRATAFDAAGNTASDPSDAMFTIADQTAPSVLLNAPNGGESWDASSTQSVSWLAADNVGVDSVNVDYSRTGPAGPWLVVQHGAPNAGSVSWTLPAQGSDSAMVRIVVFDRALNTGTDVSNAMFQIVPPAAVGVAGPGAFAFDLEPPAPNPSARAVRLSYTLASPEAVRLEVLDLQGRRVWDIREAAIAGPHAVTWDGRDAAGAPVEQGLYFVRLIGERHMLTRKLVRMQ